MREYIHYFSDIYVPYAKKTSRQISFTEQGGKTYLDFSKVTQFDHPSFEDISENENFPLMQARMDKVALNIEEREKENLLSMPVSERIEELKKTVIIHLKDFDSGERFGYMLAPYLDRFTRQSATELLESLSMDERVEILSSPTKEYHFDKRGVVKSIVWERLKQSQNIRELIPPENKRKLNESLKNLQENPKNHFKEPISRIIRNLVMDRLLG